MLGGQEVTLKFHVLDPRPTRYGWEAVRGRGWSEISVHSFVCLVDPLTSLYRLGLCTATTLSVPSSRQAQI